MGNEHGLTTEERGSYLTPNGCKIKSHVPLQISTSRKGLLSDENSPTNVVNSQCFSSRLNFSRFSHAVRLASPSAKFCHIAEERGQVSQSVSSTFQDIPKRVNDMVKKADLSNMMELSRKWIKNPLNMALLLWITCVAVSGAILFLVMTGMLNGVLPKKSQRDLWFEINNQILNALFTLMCFYQHPKRFYHLVLLCRWKPNDIVRLRNIYCKNANYKPHEWGHMMVVVVLLHVNCFAQYALCGLNLGYKRSERPAIGVGICLSVAIAAPAIAGLYCVLSPLGKEYECEVDEEARGQTGRKSLEKRLSFAPRNELRVIENRPVWRGGLFELWEDISVTYLSFFCCFCVFGWNMERLGFGNMYVHIATFILFCFAPFWIFNLAAVNIDNDTVRVILGVTGIVLCVFGLLYGGFWRIKMRKRFNLPSNRFCFGKPDITDFAQWLFCCWCSLAQEVRTVDFYDIVEEKFYRKRIGEDCNVSLAPLPRESHASGSRSELDSPFFTSCSSFKAKQSVCIDDAMNPPIPATIQKEDDLKSRVS